MKFPKREFLSMQELVTAVSDKEKTTELQNCLFCRNSRPSELCNAYVVEKKKNIMKSQGRCFICLKKLPNPGLFV